MAQQLSRIRRSVRVTLFVALVGLAACAEVVEVPGLLPAQPATTEQLTGPWQATPLVLSERMRARIEQTCRGDMQRMPGSKAGVIDVRGEGVAVVRMIEESAGDCAAIQITDTGQVAGAGGGSVFNGVEVLPPLDPADFDWIQAQPVEGGGLEVTGWALMGRAGASIAAVVVEPEGHPPLVATLQNGWFAAWWPAKLPPPGGEAPPRPRATVRGLDASGAQVVEEAYPDT